MFTYLVLFISMKLMIDARQYIITKLKTIERDENGNIKIKDPYSAWYKKFFQKSLALIEHSFKKEHKHKQKEKLKKTPQKIQDELQRNEDKKYTSKGQLSNVFYAIKKYEEFIKQDLTLLIKKAHSFLSSLKQKLIKENGFDVKLCHTEFMEITEIYNHSNAVVKRCSDKFYGYQKTILELKPSSAEHIAIESHLNKVIREIHAKEKILDLSNNKNYSFVENYFKEHNLSLKSNNFSR